MAISVRLPLPITHQRPATHATLPHGHRYPHEREILFAPLAGMEVQSIAVDNTVLAVDVRLSINLAAATMEQVVGRRRKLVQNMGENMAVEVRQALGGSGFEQVGFEMLEATIDRTALARAPEWYNEDAHFKEAVDEALQAKPPVLKARQRVEWMTERMAPTQLAPLAAAIARLVDEAPADEWDLRWAGLRLLGKLEPASLLPHASLALRCEHDADSDVANAAADVVARLRAASLLDASKSMADLVSTKVGSRALLLRARSAQLKGGGGDGGGDGPKGWDGTGEAPPLVIDVGSCNLRAGLARKLSSDGGSARRHLRPPVTMPCVVGRPDATRLKRGMQPEYVGDEALKKGELLELSLPVQHGIVEDFEALQLCWQAAFLELRVQPRDHPMFLLVPPLNPKANREQLVEMCFEVCDAPAVYVCNSPTAAIAADGRRTGVVVDIGEGNLTVTPVYGGYMLPHAVVRSHVAGREQTLALAKFLTDRDASVLPAAKLHDEARLRAVKERVARTAATWDAYRERSWRDGAGGKVGSAIEAEEQLLDENRDTVRFSHQGRELRVNVERWQVGELLFSPDELGFEVAGLQEMVNNSLMKCDVDIRLALYDNIIIVGGGAAAAGLAERLRNELKAFAPSGVAINVVVPDGPADTAWYGGTVMSALDGNGDLWIQRHEYDESGRSIVHSKCF